MQLKLSKLYIIIFIISSFITFAYSADYNSVKEKALILKDGSEEDKIAAVQEFGRLSSNANFIIDDLIFSLRNDKSHEVRMEIIRALERIGGQANKTVPALIEALGDENW